MKQLWKESFGIKSYCVDFRQLLKPSVLLQLFQEAASNHARDLGVGYQVLTAKGLFWVLSRLHTEVTAMPKRGEKIIIETWPAGIEGLFFRRDFLVYDQENRVIIRAVSGWLLVSAGTSRPQRMDVLGINLSDNEGKRSLAYFPQRLILKTDQFCYRKKVLYNEIDQNLHVNNSQYLNWITDCFDLDYYNHNNISAFSAEFLSEIHWGDEIEFHLGQKNTSSDIEAFDSLSKKVLFRAKMEWKPFSVSKKI